MARIHSFITNDERERFAEQERRFASEEDVEAFFRACDDREGRGTEPDWHEHLGVMAASRASGASET